MTETEAKKSFNLNLTQFLVTVGAWLLVLLLSSFVTNSTRSTAQNLGLMFIGVNAVRAVLLPYAYVLHRNEVLRLAPKTFPPLANHLAVLRASLNSYYLKRWVVTVFLGFVASVVFYIVVSTHQGLLLQAAAAAFFVGSLAASMSYQFSMLISASIKNRKLML